MEINFVSYSHCFGWIVKSYHGKIDTNQSPRIIIYGEGVLLLATVYQNTTRDRCEDAGGG